MIQRKKEIFFQVNLYRIHILPWNNPVDRKETTNRTWWEFYSFPFAMASR